MTERVDILKSFFRLAIGLGGSCTTQSDCNGITNGMCDLTGKCSCKSGTRESMGTCLGKLSITFDHNVCLMVSA